MPPRSPALRLLDPFGVVPRSVDNLPGPGQIADYVRHMVGGRRRRVAAERDHVHVELRDLRDDELTRLAELVEPRIESMHGVRWATVHLPTHRVVVAIDEHTTTTAADIVEAVVDAEVELELDGREFPDHPDHPADLDPVIRDLLTLSADAVGATIGLTTQILRAGPPPFQLDLSALVSVTEGTGPVRGAVERRIGEPAADVVLGVANALAQGLTSGPLGPMVDLAQRSLDLRMLGARRTVWHRDEDDLFARSPDRLDLPARVPRRPRPVPDGPIEDYADRAWLVSLGAFGVVLATSRRLERAASVLQAGVPKSARLGRSAYVAELGRLLAESGTIVLEADRLVLLDRIDTMVVAAEVVRGPDRAGFARALAHTARRAGARLLCDDPADLPDDYLETPGGRSLLDTVRHEQRKGSVVAVVHDRPTPALAAADLGIGVRTHEVAPWGAHVMVPDETGVLVLVDAIATASSVARESIGLAMIGSVAGGLTSLGTTLPRIPLGPGSIPVLAPVNVAAAFALGNGVRHAREVHGRPRPVRRDPTAWHALTPPEVLDRLGSSEKGLGVDDAVARRTPPTPTVPLPVRFVRTVGDELANPLTPVLVIGGALSAAVGSMADAALVGGVLGVNGVVGGVQRLRAEQATANLRRVRRKDVQVVRDGVGQRVAPRALVQGDVVVLAAGEVVPADCRVLSADGLEVDESSLTGESLPVEKAADPVDTAVLAERCSMLYEGSWVSSGEVTAVVVATGDQTESAVGAALAGEPPAGGVELRLQELTRRMIPLSLLAGAGVAGMGMLRGRPVGETVGAGVSLAVAAVPEGLPFVATVAQLGASRRLARRSVLVRNPRAIEALGRVDVICADKTGTLTEGRLDLRVVTDGVIEAADGDLPDELESVLVAAMRATPPGDPSDLAHPTDRAVARGGSDLGLPLYEADEAWTTFDISPFDPRRGYHAALGTVGEQPMVVVKGAPEVVLDRCVSVRRGKRTFDFDTAERDRIEAAVTRLTGRGLRVLAVADREVRSARTLGPNAVDQLRLRGLVAIADRPREEAGRAIDMLADAGIATIMITGDHPATAAGIGNELGLDGADVMTGAEIDDLDDDDLAARLREVAVVARVTPVHKVRIVQALQRAGLTVAMTGDGANDAPAIRLADVGIAVGSASTQAAQTAADLVVVDANIETIVDAVVEGRGMWASVRDAVSLLTGGNLGEIGFTVLGTAFGGAPPVNTRQLLLVNLLTDAVPAMAIALRPPPDVTPEQLLAEGPEASLGEQLDQAIMLRAITTGSAASASYLAGRVTGTLPRARTMALVTLVGTQLGQTVAAGGRDPLVVGAGVGSAAALAFVVQTPGLSQLFGCQPLGPIGLATAAWWAGIGTAGAVLVPRVAPDLRIPTLDDVTSWADRLI